MVAIIIVLFLTMLPYFTHNKGNTMNQLIYKMGYLIFGASIAILFTGCCNERDFIDLSENPKYSKWIGQVFELEKNCYITTCQGTTNYKIKEKYNLLDTAQFLGISPNNEYIGKTIKDSKIIAPIPKGTAFKIEYIYFMKAFNAANYQVYIRLLNSSHKELLLASGLLPFWHTEGIFSEEYAIPVGGRPRQ